MYFAANKYAPENMLIPRRLADYIDFQFLCELNRTEVKAISSALFAFDYEINVDPPPVNPPLRSVLAITDDNLPPLCFADAAEDARSFGCSLRLSLLRVDQWRKAAVHSEYKIAFLATLEELCHIHYQTDDELLAKRRVFSCCQRLYPDTNYDNWYDPNWQP